MRLEFQFYFPALAFISDHKETYSRGNSPEYAQDACDNKLLSFQAPIKSRQSKRLEIS